MATFTGQTIKATYKDLLQVSNSNAGIDGTIRYVSDGEGTTSVLGLSSSGVTVNGTFKISTYTIAPTGNVTFGGAVTLSGAYAFTGTLTNTTTVTFPTTGTLATLAGSETFTNKTLTAPVVTTGTFASPVLTTPVLGTPSSGTLTSCTGLPISTGVSGLGSGVATFLATPSSANLASAVTGETGSGALVFGTSPTLTTPTLGAASATSLSFSSTSGIVGTTTNDSAAAGSVGEYVSSAAAVTGNMTTTATSQNLTSISLTAGDWDVEGVGVLVTNANNTTTWTGGINTTSATVPTGGSIGAWYMIFATGATNAYTGRAYTRLSLASTTTVYLVGNATFTSTAPTFYCQLVARRVR